MSPLTLLRMRATFCAPPLRTFVILIYGAFRAFGQRVFADGALPSKTTELIAVAVAHVTQCPYCIRGHTELALKKGATEQELMEAIWVAAEIHAGAAYAHSILAIDAMHQGNRSE